MITIEPLELPYSSRREGNIKLLEYQKEVLEKQEKLISIDAPTGSGKTLAMLRKALDSMDKGTIALFLYPTNELLQDQLNSFRYLLDLLCYNHGMIDIGNNGLKIDDTDILVLGMNGQYLEHFARDKSKGGVIWQIFNSYEVANSKLLVLSNIDFVYTLIRGQYHRAELSFPDMIGRLSFIAVDELHMYWGTMLLSLLFTLKTLEKVDHIVISSATHTKTLKTVVDSLQTKKAAVHAEEGSGRVVRHKTELEITSFDDKPYLSSEEEVEKIIEIVLGMLESCKDILCIFNSVIFAEKVANQLREKIGEEIGRIHGFIPKKDRKNMRNRRIVVGTSSIEVGVDFKRECLIFEANNAPTFLQRFGRIGRHNEGCAIAILPFDEKKNLHRLLEGHSKIPFKELEKDVWRVMNIPQDYSEVKNSESGVRLYLSYLASLIYLSKRVYGVTPEKAEFTKLKKVLENLEKYAISDVFNPNINSELLKRVVKQLKIPKVKQLVETSRVFPRGGMPSVPVLYKEFGTFEMMPINNLEKADVSVVQSTKFSRDVKPRWLKILEKLENSVPVFVIEGVNLGNRLRVIVYDSSEDVFTLNTFKLLSEWDEEVSGTIERLLQGLPAYFTFSVPDWRLSCLKAKKGRNKGYVILGGDAYICQELRRDSI